jgi:hypothetical protein
LLLLFLLSLRFEVEINVGKILQQANEAGFFTRYEKVRGNIIKAYIRPIS